MDTYTFRISLQQINKHKISISKFLSEGMFFYKGFSLFKSKHPLFLHFPGLFFKILFLKLKLFGMNHTTIKIYL